MGRTLISDRFGSILPNPKKIAHVAALVVVAASVGAVVIAAAVAGAAAAAVVAVAAVAAVGVAVAAIANATTTSLYQGPAWLNRQVFF